MSPTWNDRDDLTRRYELALQDNLSRALRERVQRDRELREKAERQRRRFVKRDAPPPRTPVRVTPSTIQVGTGNEHRAAHFLEGKGYTLVEKNFRCGIGELDLVMRDGETLVFVEVRSRHDADHGHAAEMVDVRKRRKVSRVARFYLGAMRPTYDGVRFDVVAITGAKLDHIEDAWRLTA